MEFFGHEVHVEMPVFDPLRRGGPDRAELRPADFPRIVVKLVEDLEESVHPVGAGEDNPLVSVRVLHQLGKFAQILGSLAFDQRHLVNIGPEVAQGAGQFRGTNPAAGHHDPAAG